EQVSRHNAGRVERSTRLRLRRGGGSWPLVFSLFGRIIQRPPALRPPPRRRCARACRGAEREGRWFRARGGGTLLLRPARAPCREPGGRPDLSGVGKKIRPGSHLRAKPLGTSGGGVRV